VCRDPDDNILLETALRGRAKYVVSRDEDITRDRDLFTHLGRHGIQAATISHFLDQLKMI
jgi:predicted nucleic acid-binding protein